MKHEHGLAARGEPESGGRTETGVTRGPVDDPAAFLSRILHLDDPEAGDRVALSGKTASCAQVTYAQLARSAGAAGRAFAAAGVVPGDRVALVAPYGPSWVATFLGALSCGAVAVPLDPSLAAPDLAPLLRDADPAVVCFGRDQADRVHAALGAAGVTATALAVPALASTADSPAITPATSAAAVPRRPQDEALVVYTSGATGAPKGVAVSWANLAYQVSTVARRERTPADAVFVSILPAHHLFELVGGCLAPLYLGGRVHYPGSLLPADIVAAVIEHRATDLVVVPLVLTALRRRVEASPDSVAGVTTLRRIFVGGAPLDPELAGFFDNLGLHVCQGYGLTEASPIVAANTPWENRLGSVGRVLPGTEVRTDARGEIQVRGPGVMLGYWRQPELTAAAIDAHGWLRTGDLGHIDGDGYIFVTGRAKNLIVLPNGENVQPEEVESVIRRSGLVRDVCVLGQRGPRGEEVVAVVTGGDEVPRAAERERGLVGEVRRLVAELAPHKRPSRIVVHDGELPQTATRKVRRAAVEELLTQPPRSVHA